VVERKANAKSASRVRVRLNIRPRISLLWWALNSGLALRLQVKYAVSVCTLQALNIPGCCDCEGYVKRHENGCVTIESIMSSNYDLPVKLLLCRIKPTSCMHSFAVEQHITPEV